ncbi:hepatic lectin-like [Pseudorasbora parva]|uniref:hepatic lectin-like n=1 Tax=Pseudorasbora parva TaxID=51549 RepID=UPI00351F08F2
MSYYGNMNVPRNHDMDREDEEEMTVYCNADPISRSDTKSHQTPQHTGSDTVRNRSSRAARVCLVLLCVLLLTAVIVLCVHIHTKSTNYTEETHRLLTKITNLTKERDELLNGWVYYKSSLYFFSSEKKSWTDSRRYCTERRADLIIINNREEQGFVRNISADVFWIGLTDGDVEGRWEWVDGSTLTSGFWLSGEPNSYRGTDEDCAVIYGPGGADYPCNHTIQWICEKVLKSIP